MKVACGPLDRVATELCRERLSVAKLVQAYFPYHSTCGRCGFPWPLVRSHDTMYSETSGCFPLCEDCWVELKTPANRMPYYRQLVAKWSDPDRWKAVEAAVHAEGNDAKSV